MSWNINQTANVLGGLESPGSKAMSYGLSALLVSLPCIAAYNMYRRQDSTTQLPQGAVDGYQNYNGGKDIRVSKLFIHPIKSCRAIPVEQVAYTPEGLENDRLWCIADAETNTLLTARQHAKMVLITPSIDLGTGSLVVTFPSGSGCETLRIPLRPNAEVLSKWRTVDGLKHFGEKDIDGYICESLSPEDPSPSQVFSRYIGKPVNFLYKGPRTRHCGRTTAFPDLDASLSYQDGYPLLVLSEESMNSIEQELSNHIGKQGIDERWKDGKVAIERFRPNIVFSGAGPFAEDDWTEVSIGDLKPDAPGFSIVSRCARCLLPNVDVRTGERDAAVPYKVLMKFRMGLEPKEKYKPCVGCNAVPHTSGVLRVGDSVVVRRLLD